MSPAPNATNITVLLQQWRSGDRSAEERLFEIVLPELKRIAQNYMSRERRDHTLQATELISQIYGRLTNAKTTDWQDRRHFFSLAARAMRRYLIEHARARPNGTSVALDEFAFLLHADCDIETAVMVDSLLDNMAQENPLWCSVVELKFFLGLTDQETAETLDLPLRTVQRSWHDARSWLFERIGKDGSGAADPR